MRVRFFAVAKVAGDFFASNYSDGGVQVEYSAEPHYFTWALQHHSRIEEFHTA